MEKFLWKHIRNIKQQSLLIRDPVNFLVGNTMARAVWLLGPGT